MVQSNAYCRAEYDENELDGGFCCQTIAVELFSGYAMQISFLTHAMGTYKKEKEILHEGKNVYWGAEYFSSASGLAASAITMAAAAIAFTQWAWPASKTFHHEKPLIPCWKQEASCAWYYTY